MKTVTIYGVKYPVVQGVTDVPDMYYYDKELHEEPLDTKQPKLFCMMEDDTLVGVYTNHTIYIIIAIIAVVTALIVGGIYLYNYLNKPQPLGGTMIKTDTFSNDVVMFNAMPQCNGKEIDIRFTNGKTPATISIKGDEIITQTVTVEAGGTLATIPAKVKDGVTATEAVLSVAADGVTQDYPILIEVPANLNRNGGGLFISEEDLITADDDPFKNEVILNDK